MVWTGERGRKGMRVEWGGSERGGRDVGKK